MRFVVGIAIDEATVQSATIRGFSVLNQRLCGHACNNVLCVMAMEETGNANNPPSPRGMCSSALKHFMGHQTL